MKAEPGFFKKNSAWQAVAPRQIVSVELNEYGSLQPCWAPTWIAKLAGVVTHLSLTWANDTPFYIMRLVVPMEVKRGDTLVLAALRINIGPPTPDPDARAA